jgi:Cupin domain
VPSVPLPLSPLPVSERPVYVVAGGNHITLLLDRRVSGGLVDVIDVLAQPGGGPPPHRHAFAEWFCVLAGELTISEERDGRVACTRTLTAGESVFVPPWNAQSLQRPSTISSHRTARSHDGLLRPGRSASAH